MSDNFKLSSEQALDDYFFGLLDDSQQPEDVLAADEQAEHNVAALTETLVPEPESEPEPELIPELAPDLNLVPVSEANQESISEPSLDASVLRGDALESPPVSSHQPFDFNQLDESAHDDERYDFDGGPPSLRAMATPVPQSQSALTTSQPEEPELRVPEVRFTAPRSKSDMAQLQRLLDQMSAMQDQVVSESEACVAELHQLAALSEETEASVETGLDAPGWFEDQGSEGDRVQEDAVYSLPLAETAVLDISEPQLAPFAEPEDDFRLMQHLPQIAAAPEMPEPEESTSTALEPVQELVQEPIQDIAEAPVLETSSQPEMEILASAPDDDMLKGAVPETTVAESNQTVSAEPPPPSWVLPASSELSEFQALFFAVNGVTFAVPLTELGGIHQLGELSHLIGRPDWYLGLQSEQKRQLDVVDTARWVMPESIHSDDHRENYRYVVMLGESKWGLACDQLHGTETLTKQNVRWREKAGKRPWLAGMVKEKMCALIHVNELISMLKAGLDVNSIM